MFRLKLFKDGLIDKKQAFMSAIDFDKYINNEVKIQDKFKWIDLCGSKAREKAICNAETSFKKFFKGESKFPSFKKKKNQDIKLYFPKNNKTDWKVERHRINIPTIGRYQLKEKAYIPTNAIVKSGTISFKAGRYYVSVLCDIQNNNDYSQSVNEGIGVDLGIKDLAIVSNIDKPFKNIIKLEAQTKKINQQLTNIRHNYINNITTQLIKQKPSYITIEDLNVKGMMKNKHLSKAVAKQCFHEFRRQLEYKCKWNNIELRIVDSFYPSSKTCNCCGYIKKDLKLSDREFICPSCGVIEDRDKNASYNLRDVKLYKIA